MNVISMQPYYNTRPHNNSLTNNLYDDTNAVYMAQIIPAYPWMDHTEKVADQTGATEETGAGDTIMTSYYLAAAASQNPPPPLPTLIT